MKSWAEYYGELPAVAHILRRELPERWLRIHSLPESQRYANTEPEYAELLRRHNDVAAEVLGDAEPVVICLCTWGRPEDHAASFAEFRWARRLSFSEIVVVKPDATDGPLAVSASPALWSAGHWDDLIRDIADDRLPSVALYNPRSGEVYAPYDGGADLFLASRGRVAELRHRWSDWLSSHPEGL